MDNAQILKLVEAGFTADEIRKMETVSPETEIKTEIIPDEQSEKNPPHESEVKTNDNEVLSQLTSTVAELSKTVKELQTNNINDAKGSAPSTGDKIKEVMDSFIKEL